MTEAEWLTCDEPLVMLRAIRDATTDRKARLFACACFRRVWHLFTDGRSRRAVYVVERYADGSATDEELQTANVQANAAANDAGDRVSEADADYSDDRSADHAEAYARAEAVSCICDGPCFVVESIPEAGNAVHSTACGVGCHSEADVYRQGGDHSAARTARDRATAEENAAQAVLLRDVFGNPFRPVEFDPDWRTDTAKSLAQQMYDSREFAAMPILADALEDAGCDADDVLTHCREANATHVRGCWVVDGVLGKE